MLTFKQKEFCKQVSLGLNPTEAYRIAFKSKSAGTCKVNGSKLLKSKEINEEISQLKAENKAISLATKTEAAKELAPNSIADVAERMQKLTSMMRGELEREDVVFVEGQPKKIKVKPTFSDMRGAIVELNKMCGDYAPAKSEVSISEKPKIIFPGDEPTDE